MCEEWMGPWEGPGVSPWTYLDLLGHAWSYQCSRFASASLPDLVLISLCRQNLSVRRGR